MKYEARDKIVSRCRYRKQDKERVASPMGAYRAYVTKEKRSATPYCAAENSFVKRIICKQDKEGAHCPTEVY